jgi:hypothetical protein
LSDKTEIDLGVSPHDSLSPAWITGGVLGFWAGVGLTVFLTRWDWPSLGPRIARAVPNRFQSRGSSRSGSRTKRGGPTKPGGRAERRGRVKSAIAPEESESEAVESPLLAADTTSDGTTDGPGSDSADATSGDEGADPDLLDRDSADRDSDERTAADVVEAAEVELVSDAELVQRMLRAESGRMRQSEIVDATGWSKAKVSRRLSAMADEGELTKVQIGRENLICLEDAVPDPAVSRNVPSSGRTGGLTATLTGQ